MSTTVRLPEYDQVERVDGHVLDIREMLESRDTVLVTVKLNVPNSGYELPTDTAARAALLNGAKIFVKAQGVDEPYETPLIDLENASHTFRVKVTDAAKIYYSTAGIRLGGSGYMVAANTFKLTTNDAAVEIRLTSRKIAEGTVEICRIQPWTDNPAASSIPQSLSVGSSFLGTRVTNNGVSTLYAGHFKADGLTWVDECQTKVVVYDCPNNGTDVATERVISDGGNAESAVDLMERLNVLKNLRMVSVAFNGAGTAHLSTEMEMMRFEPVYIKRELVTLTLKKETSATDATLIDYDVKCLVTWFCNEQLSGYRLMEAFYSYQRNGDGSYSATPRDCMYIPRYPISATENLSVTVDGSALNKTVVRCKSGEGRESVPGHRGVTLDYVKNLNYATAVIKDGEDEITLLPDTEMRNITVCGTQAIGFMQAMQYLFFGVNVQGAAAETLADNIFPGICTTASGQTATTNGDTNFITGTYLTPKTWTVDGEQKQIWTGAANSASIHNSIVFLGIEDGLHSSQGWYNENLTFVTRKTYATNAEGSCSPVDSYAMLGCTDPAFVHPIDTRAETANQVNNNSPSEISARQASASFDGSFEDILKDTYHYVEIDGVTGTASAPNRAADITDNAMRDMYLPTGDNAAANINMGRCDNFWRGGVPGALPSFSASASYSVGSYVMNDWKLYRVISEHSAGAFNDDFEVCANTVVTVRNYFTVALGYYRSGGSYLGSFSLCANIVLSGSHGRYWRARPFLLRSLPANEASGV